MRKARVLMRTKCQECQDPDEYATPHTEEELDENFGDADFTDDEEPYDGMEIGF